MVHCVLDVPKQIFNQSNTLYLQGDEWKQVIFCCRRNYLHNLDAKLLTKLMFSPVVVGKIVKNVSSVEGPHGSLNCPIPLDSDQYAFKAVNRKFIIPCDGCRIFVLRIITDFHKENVRRKNFRRKN